MILNNYPLKIINKYLVNGNSNATKTNQKETTNNLTKYYKIPYVKQLSNNIQRILNDEHTQITFNHPKTIFHLDTRLKDKTNMLPKINTIYQIKCGACEKFYKGQTKQKLKYRINQHKYNIKKVRKELHPIIVRKTPIAKLKTLTKQD